MGNKLDNTPESMKRSQEKFQKQQEENTDQDQDQVQESQQVNNEFATEIVDLPSGGLLYPEDNPLSSGNVEMKYMTAKEEDIISTESYIKNNVVFDKLFKSLIVSDIKYDDILVGDRNALILYTRIYGYGPMYQAEVMTPSGNKQEVEVDLREIIQNFKSPDRDLITPHENLFKFEMPENPDGSVDVVEFKLLTVGDQKKIEKNVKMKSKYKGGVDTTWTNALKEMIVSVNGSDDLATVRNWVDNLIVYKSRALKNYIKEVQPDVDLSLSLVDEETGENFRAEFEIGIDLIWPDAKLGKV